MERNRVRDAYEFLIEKIFLISALVGVVSVIAIIAFVFYKGLHPFFGTNAYPFFDFITGTKWAPSEGVYGILHMIVASIVATCGAIVVGVPIGLLTAAFLSEIADQKLVMIIKPAVELLAGIPSVLYGVFGVGVIVPAIAKITPQVQGQSILAVMIVLTIMILPTIITLSEAALRAVPNRYREASLGLGASPTQTIFKATIPAAKSGILSAAVLGVGRAIGETMAVMLVAGNPESGMLSSIWDQIRPLTTNIAMEMGYASGQQQEMLFATGVVLFIFIMIVNLAMIMIAARGGED